MKIINKIFIIILPLIIVWFFIIAIRYNGNVSNLFIDLKSTFNRLVYNVSSDIVYSFSTTLKNFDYVTKGVWLEMLGSFDFGNVNDLVSFFVAIGNFFKGIGLFLYSLVLFIYYGIISIFNLVASVFHTIWLVFEFIINPITYTH